MTNETWTLRPVTTGKLTGHVLCFEKTRILRFEVQDGKSLALLPWKLEPDLVVCRGTVLSKEKVSELREKYLVCRNGLASYTDANGGSYLAVVVAEVTQ